MMIISRRLVSPRLRSYLQGMRELAEGQIARFVEMRSAFRSHWDWSLINAVKNVTILTAMRAEGDPAAIAADISATAKQLKKLKPHIPPFRDQTRFVTAAILKRENVAPQPVAEQVHESRAAWKEAGLRSDEPCRSLSLLGLYLLDQRSPDPLTLTGVKRGWDDVKKANFWTIGPSLLPLIALLAAVRPDRLTELVPAIARFRADGPSDMSYTHIPAAVIGLFGSGMSITHQQRCAGLKQDLKAAGFRKTAGETSTLALAALTDTTNDELVTALTRAMAEAKAVSPRINDMESIAFRLVLQVADLDNNALEDVAASMDIIAAVLEYQAMVAAVVAGGTAAAAS